MSTVEACSLWACTSKGHCEWVSLVGVAATDDGPEGRGRVGSDSRVRHVRHRVSQSIASLARARQADMTRPAERIMVWSDTRALAETRPYNGGIAVAASRPIHS